MLHIIEVLGLLAPVAALALLVHYRDRSRPAFAWGLAGGLLGLLGSAAGLVATRASIAGALTAGGGLAESVALLGTWGMVRLGLLLAAVATLVVAALVDRARRRRPLGWVVGGVLLAVLGLVLGGVEPEVPGHEGVTMLLELLLEAVQAALVGVAVLLLAVAAVAHRDPGGGAGGGGQDSRPEPTELARSLGMAAWRVYADHRWSRDR